MEDAIVKSRISYVFPDSSDERDLSGLKASRLHVMSVNKMQVKTIVSTREPNRRHFLINLPSH